MRAYFSAVLLGSALALLGVGCSSDSGSSSDEFISKLCAEFADCCKAAGRPADGAQCRALYSAFLPKGSYDAAAGDACLSEVRAAGAKKCDTASSNTPSCSKVLGSSGGTKKPGETCEDDSDCAPADGGRVSCAVSFMNSATVQQCQVQLPGKAGDSPCVGTVDGNITFFSGSSTTIVPRGYLCDVADGVTCDGTSNACVALAAVGEPCTTGDQYQCVATAYCPFPDEVCKPKVALGSACDSNEACPDGAACDQTSKTCVALLAVGAACASNSDCQSSNCTNQKCGAKDDLGLALLCGTN